MEAIKDIIGPIQKSYDTFVVTFKEYIRENAWTLIGLAIAIYYLKNSKYSNKQEKRILVLIFSLTLFISFALQGYNITVDKILSYLRDSLRDPKKVESNARKMSEDMRRVRLRQQEMTNKLAIQAAIVRKEKKKEKEKKEKERKKSQRLGGDGGDGSSGRRSDSSSYNPMQPWSSGSGSSYRPPRRTVNRGGG